MADQPKKKIGPKKKARDEFDEDEIFQAPEITREPMSRQAKLGSKVVIRVTATGKPLPSYQWYHNGKKIVGASTDRLTLSKVRRQAAGAYHCEVKNFVGKATSRVAMLSFFTSRVPKLEIGPEIAKVEEGKPFKLKVTSPSAAELKDFKIYWIFNGMRIKGAQGPELSISAAKKKYEGEYKAMIALGGTLETSNVAKVILKKPKKSASAEPGAAPEAASGSLEEMLAQEPTKELAPAPAEAVAKADSSWEDFLFNPEEEDEEDAVTEPDEPSLVAPSPGSDAFGNTSPGTPGAPKAPLSQLATQDLIREVAARGGASDLIEEVEREDPSALILAADAAGEAPLAAQEDPSSLIEVLERREEAPVASAKKMEAPAGETGEEENLIADWGIVPDAPAAKPAARPAAPVQLPKVPQSKASPAPSPVRAPGLERKKEFLEKLLGRFQAQHIKRAA